MSITILPARLANQIAAGEVVERPASVVKELVENSLDAGATHIQVDIEKGGTKRIRIIDNGKGIVESELTLALSRHATSKIKSLDDLEAISSLGFRGEALASISSVARLTLTSKPAEQGLAWQAYAEGRDMKVALKPAAHPDGTTIDVIDLFFNTPARRKFLRTEKTEFAHIEEVIKRIALARFDVSFVLTHNGKTIKQYRKIAHSAQNIKRIAAVCGQNFVDHAIEIDCKHDDIHLSGWVAKPSYTRKQNDLCYSYVNGRMMRDKLINHAIRQAYGEFIDNDVYSAFVLFLSVDYKDVDVNVHPAKHEVRFHQSRYVHDFIYSVCHKALAEQIVLPSIDNTNEPSPSLVNYSNVDTTQRDTSINYSEQTVDRSYVQPLQQQHQQVQEKLPTNSYANPHQKNFGSSKVSPKAAANYQTLMSVDIDNAYSPSETSEVKSTERTDTPSLNINALPEVTTEHLLTNNTNLNLKLLYVHEEKYIVYQRVHEQQNSLGLCLITPLSVAQQLHYITDCWQENAECSGVQSLISQPLLLPVKIKVEPTQRIILETYNHLLVASGIHVSIHQNNVQIRQFPALLRAKDVTHTFEQLLALLMTLHENLSPETNVNSEFLTQWQHCLAQLSAPSTFTLSDVQQLWKVLTSSEKIDNQQLNSLLNLNSASIDLISVTSQLDEHLANH